MSQMDVKVIFSEFENYCATLDRNVCISYPVIISWSRVGGPYHGKPVAVILREPRLPGDLPPGELQVPAEILDEVRQAGYHSQPLSLREIKDYWREARRLNVSKHCHPEARLVRY
jgi:hypothetical protein